MRKVFYIGFQRLDYKITYRIKGRLRRAPFTSQDFRVEIHEHVETWEHLIHNEDCKRKAINLVPPEIEIDSIRMQKITDCKGEVKEEWFFPEPGIPYPENTTIFEKVTRVLLWPAMMMLKFQEYLINKLVRAFKRLFKKR